MKPKPKPFLNRYTNLPVLLDWLTHKKITLLSPSSWEDQNDAFYIERYQQEKGFETVLALCFTTKRETFHHWKIFSDGPAGVCIEFDKRRLIESFDGKPEFQLRDVTYKFIKNVEKVTPAVDDWPFLKRMPFKDEGEFRIVYQRKLIRELAKDVTIDIGSIKKIWLSPWLHESTAKTVIEIIKSLDGCHGIKVKPSALIKTKRWRAAIEKRKSIAP